MSVRLKAGWDRPSTVRLPEGKTNIDIATPLGSAMAGNMIRVLKSANTMEDVGNALTLFNSVTTSDSSQQGRVLIGREEKYILSNGKKTVEVADAKAMDSLLSNGWTLQDTKTEDIYDE